MAKALILAGRWAGGKGGNRSFFINLFYRRDIMKKRKKGREKKKLKHPTPYCHFRDGTVNYFPEIRLVTGLEVRRGR